MDELYEAWQAEMEYVHGKCPTCGGKPEVVVGYTVVDGNRSRGILRLGCRLRHEWGNPDKVVGFDNNWRPSMLIDHFGVRNKTYIDSGGS